MKKFVLVISLLLAGKFVNAQGLENIVVERFYISEGNDTTVNSIGGVLPVNSTTWRIYVDLAQGWRLQSVYGDGNHECRIETTTLFFNNEDRGAVTANAINFNNLDDNTVMLDSYVSVGASCNNKMGILKVNDDGVGTVVNNDGVLQSSNPLAGIPLTSEDGSIATGIPEPVTIVGINTELAVFDNQNDGTNGPVFSTNNGAWASLNGAVGPDPVDNKILIAQITTDGDLTFHLNIQIRQDSTFTVENYVAQSPQGAEILFPALNFDSQVWVGTPDLSATDKLSFNLYPNPVADVLTVEVIDAEQPVNIEYAIYDIAGSLIAKKDLGNVTGRTFDQIDVSDLAPGFYVVQMMHNGISSARQFVKH